MEQLKLKQIGFFKTDENVMPLGCSSWPSNVETSGDFNWNDVFNF